MTKGTERYRIPTRLAFRQMGLGKVVSGHIKVVAGFQYYWWDPEERMTPLFVNARVIRTRAQASEHRSGMPETPAAKQEDEG